MSVIAAESGLFARSPDSSSSRATGFGFAFWLRHTHGIEHAAGVLTAAHDHAAGAGDFEDAVFAFDEDLNQALDLAFDAGDLDHQRLGREIDDARTEDFDELEDVRTGLRRCSDLDQREFAADAGRLAYVVHLQVRFRACRGWP